MALIFCDFYSKALGRDTGLRLIFPEYGLIGEHKIRLCTLLHSQEQDASYWVRRTDIDRIAAELNVTVVMPEVAKSFFIQMPNEKNFRRFLREELPEFLMQTFPFLSKDPKDHMIVGNGGSSAEKIREIVEDGCSFYGRGKCLPCDFNNGDLKNLLSQPQICAVQKENPERG